MAIVYFVLNALATTVLLIIGSLVLIKSPKEKINRIFALFVLVLATWITSNYLSNLQSLSYSVALLLNHLVLMSASLSLYIFLWFVYVTAPPITPILQRITRFILYFGLATSFFAVTPFVIKSISRQKEASAVIFGNLATIYFFGVILAVLGVIVLLILGLRRAKGLERNRLNIILWSIIGTVLIALVTNLFIPVVTGSFELTNIGPLSTLLLASGLAYSIIKFKLFDIRLIIARSVAYIASLVSIGVLYASIAFILLNATFYKSNKLTLRETLLFTLLAVFLIFTFQPVKKFFDRFSNRLFYRDVYDPQELLNMVNSALVIEPDLYKLLNNTAETIRNNLKIEFCNFYVDEKSSIDFHVAGTGTKLFANEHWVKISEILDDNQQKIISEIEDNNEEVGLLLGDLHIGAIVKMTSQDQSVGYLISGQKRSGNTYAAQDVQILEIIADEVAIAVQNNLRFVEIAQFNVTLQKKIEIATAELQRSN
ncbi:MAG: hypothetical protein M0R39_16785, partial [Prolixibacteraceae bacterium]|nr:hypothetical protein [Prolixibacteraceae bacterium]